MSSSILAAELEGRNDFQQVLIAAVVDKATQVLNTPQGGSRADSSRSMLAGQLVVDRMSIISKFGRAVALRVVAEDGSFLEADVPVAVSEVFDSVAGVQTESGALALSSLAQSSSFQQRVYMIGAQLANDILKSEYPAPDAPEAVKAVDSIKRVFALKYQAGKFILGPNQFNYAVNVVAGVSDEVAADEITDLEIRERLEELTNLFASTQARLLASGIQTGLLA